MKKKLLSFLIGAGVLIATTTYATTLYQGYQGALGIGSATSGQVGYVPTVSSSSPFLT